METKDLEAKFANIDAELKKYFAKHEEEVKNAGAATLETKTALDKLGKEWNEIQTRLLNMEQKLVPLQGGPMGNERKSAGEIFTESDAYKRMVGTQNNFSDKVPIGETKTAIVNATLNTLQPLVAADRNLAIIPPGLRRLTIRDLIPNNRTSSNVVTFTRELAFTNNAASQTGGSPQAGENVEKAESALTFEMKSAVVETLAHWIPASRQILQDAPALQDYINSRLMYGLKLAEENQLLTGDGTSNKLDGLINNSTAFDTTYSATSDTFIDVIRKAMTQVQDSFYDPSGVILNPRDWETIQLTKTTGTASSGEYIFSNPHVVEDNRIWGLPVVPTAAMERGQFMVGAFNLAAAIWDHAGATIEVSREHASYFTYNMVAILCEERLCITVFRPLSLVYGGFPYGS